MKQNIIQLSSLLIILLVGTASAIKDTGTADDVLLVSMTGSNVTDSNVSITYSETGPFKGGDVVRITATFIEPVELADLTVDSGGMLLLADFMVGNVSDTVWFYDYEIPGGINGAVNVTVSGINMTGYQITETDDNAFIIDNKPSPVSNLTVTDALSDTTWYYSYDEPGLYVQWDKNIEEDPYGGGEYSELSYFVFISDFEPSSINEMKVAVPVSTIYETEDNKSLFMNIGEYGGKPLVYGKDYWVAVVSMDMAGNYGSAMYGPAQTYEDMNITLNAGWNLKSVPKRLATFNADTCSAFGNNSTVIYWNGNCWEFPKTIEPCKGYWVYTPAPCGINVKFKPMPINSTSPDIPASLDLAPGWQMIGHTSKVPVDWSTTLASLKDTLNGYKYSNLITYSQDEGWGGIIPDTDFYIILVGDNETSFNGTGSVSLLQTDGFMAPGQGYWIFMTENATYASIENVDVYAA